MPDGSPPPSSAEGPLDVVGVGSPLVDVLSITDESFLERVGLVKGSMTLVDQARAREIYEAMGGTTEVSGGSAANTMAGVAALGGTAGFVGKVADDPLGEVFVHDLRASGVEFGARPPVPPETDGDAEVDGTGRCLVLVTPDGERTMATHLGVAGTISPGDLPSELVARGRLLYLEGYLFDLPPAKEAMRRAIGVAFAHDGSVALSLSDSLCVDRHQHDFLELLHGDVDVLFANEEEALALFGSGTFDDAVAAVEETGVLGVITRGAQGAVVVTASGPVEVPAVPVAEVVDATGAGDLFAAGFLYGLARGSDPERAARLGALCASEVISHLGARPQRDLRRLASDAGLLGY